MAVDVTLLADDLMVLHVGHDGLVMDAMSMFLSSVPGGAPTAAARTTRCPRSCRSRPTSGSARACSGRAPAERSRAYWTARLDDFAPHPDLPLRTSPSAIQTPRFTQRTVSLDATCWRALKSRAAGAGLTPSCLLLAAYAETLARWGAGDRFTIITTVANRPPIHPRVLDAIGNFSDTILVEVARDPGAAFEDRALALQAQLRRDLDNRHVSGVDVIAELARRRGTSQARMPFTFNSAIGYVRPGVDGSCLQLFGPEVHSVSQTPQVWLNFFAMEQDGGLLVQLDGVDESSPTGCSTRSPAATASCWRSCATARRGRLRRDLRPCCRPTSASAAAWPTTRSARSMRACSSTPSPRTPRAGRTPPRS